MYRLDPTRAMVLTGRACLSAIFLISGTRKLLSPEATVAEIESVGLPFPGISLATAIAIELLGGVALLVGYAVRWAAGALAAFTLVAGLCFHSAFEDPNQLTHFMKNVAITGGLLLAIVAMDCGSTDRRRR